MLVRGSLFVSRTRPRGDASALSRRHGGIPPAALEQELVGQGVELPGGHVRQLGTDVLLWTRPRDDAALGARTRPIEAVASLSGLDSLVDIVRISCESNDALVSLALDSTRRIHQLKLGGCFADGPSAEGVGSNASLVSIDGLASIEKVSFISILGQENLVSLAGLRARAEGGAVFSSVFLGLNPQLSTEEIRTFEAAANLEVHVCQNRDDNVPCDNCPMSE